MWAAGRWKDVQVLDCGGGEKAERWGRYVLVRPDPQAIWPRRCGAEIWERADGVYRRSPKGGGAWVRRAVPESWTASYGALTFGVKPMNFKHTGLFPEQAANWDFMAEAIRAAGRPVRVLNLFAYTGGATLACAAAGAEVCHVDASRGMVQWARENARLSGLEGRPIRWIVDDCRKFVQREIRRGRRYDAVVMDPPSYGRGPSGEMWKIEEDIAAFVRLVADVMSERPLFAVLNSYTAGLSPSAMAYVLADALCPRFGGAVGCDELGLPVRSTGLCLPCGSAARWTAGREGGAG